MLRNLSSRPGGGCGSYGDTEGNESEGSDGEDDSWGDYALLLERLELAVGMGSVAEATPAAAAGETVGSCSCRTTVRCSAIVHT